MESVLPNSSATTDAFKIESVIPNSSASTDAVTGKKYNVGIIIIYSLFFLACLWIILINGLLIFCFWFNRGEAWCSHS